MPRVGAIRQQTVGKHGATTGKECEVVLRRWILASAWIGEGPLDEIPVVRAHEEEKNGKYYPGERSGCSTSLLVPY